MGEKDLSKWIYEVAHELVDRFVKADGKLNDDEYERLNELRKTCGELIEISDSLEMFNELKNR